MNISCGRRLRSFGLAALFLCLLIPADLDAKGEVSAVRFRLGSAAAPFGWSTVVADFDADYETDVAIADRRGQQTFSIEIALSQDRSQFVAFASTASALTITARDVDKDEDLDVVVSHLLTDEVVGMWVNDGQGRFTEDDPRAYDLGDASLQSRIASATPKAPELIGNRRSNDDFFADARLSSALASSGIATASLRISARHADVIFGGAPRGPPCKLL